MQADCLEILDLALSANGSLSSATERYDRTSADPEFVVEWNAIRCPQGFQSVGNGVAFLQKARGENWRRQSISQELTELTKVRFKWEDTVHSSKMLLIIILPPGFAPVLTHLLPMPSRAKSYKDRVALCWDLEKSDTIVEWEMLASSGSLEESVRAINNAPGHQSKGRVVRAGGVGVFSSLTDPATWLLNVAANAPFVSYAVGVTGFAAAAAVCVGFFFGNAPVALLAIAAVIGFATLLRVLSGDDYPLERRVVVWIGLLSYATVMVLGLIALSNWLILGPAKRIDVAVSSSGDPKTDEDLVWKLRSDAENLIDMLNEADKYDANGKLSNPKKLSVCLDESKSIIRQLKQIPEHSLCSLYKVMKYELIAQANATAINCLVIRTVAVPDEEVEFSKHESQLVAAAQDGLEATDFALSELNHPTDDSVRLRGGKLLSTAKVIEWLGFLQAEFLATKVLVEGADKSRLIDHIRDQQKQHEAFWLDNSATESPVLRFVLKAEKITSKTDLK